MTRTLTERPAPPVPPPPATEASRYLCAAYMDRQYADHVVKRVLRERHRAVAPSYGVDLHAVVRHCLAARRRTFARALALTVVLVALPGFVWLGATPLGALLRVLVLAWGLVFLARSLNRYEVLAGRLVRDRFDARTAPRGSARDEKLIGELELHQLANVTVYSGFSPFVGCGLDRGGWSFVVDVRKGKEDLAGRRQPMAFEADELYAALLETVRSMQVPSLRVEDRLFMNGRDVRGQRWILPDDYARPLPWVDPAVVHEYVRAPTQRVRHYLAVQLVDWKGELVLSLFLRFNLVGGSLFCEGNYFLLPPVKEKYHQVDDVSAFPDARALVREIALSAVFAPFLLVLAPFHVLERLFGRWTAWLERRATRRLIRNRPMFDYGATTTIRQEGMSGNFRHYFQKLDELMYTKLVQKKVFESIATFLDARNIDTGELRERQATVLNSGVIITGGEIKADSLAVGTGARAFTQMVRPGTRTHKHPHPRSPPHQGVDDDRGSEPGDPGLRRVVFRPDRGRRSRCPGIHGGHRAAKPRPGGGGPAPRGDGAAVGGARGPGAGHRRRARRHPHRDRRARQATAGQDHRHRGAVRDRGFGAVRHRARDGRGRPSRCGAGGLLTIRVSSGQRRGQSGPVC